MKTPDCGKGAHRLKQLFNVWTQIARVNWRTDLVLIYKLSKFRQ